MTSPLKQVATLRSDSSACRTRFNVRQSYCARYWYRLDVCLSVRMAVCPSHAGIVSKRLNLSSNCLHSWYSPMILVFWEPKFSPEFQWDHPNGVVKCKGVGKSCNFRPISRYSPYKRLKIDGYMLRCFDKHWILFSSMWHLPRLSQGRTQARPKCALGWLQKLTHVPLAIATLLGILLSLTWRRCRFSSL